MKVSVSLAISQNSELFAWVERHLLAHFLEQGAVLGIGDLGHDDLQDDILVAVRLAGQPATGEPQLLAGLRAGLDRDVDGTAERRDLDGGTQPGFPGCQRQDQAHILALDREQPMRLELDLHVEVAIGGAAEAGTALALQADLLPLGDPLRNLDVERPGLGQDVALLVEAVGLQRERAAGAMVGFLQRDLDPIEDVLARNGEPGAAVPRPTIGPAGGTLAEHRLEEVAEACRIGLGVAAAAEAGLRLPARRRLEFLARRSAVAPQLVVLLALGRVFENLVGLTELLELLGRVFALVEIRVVVAGELSIGLLDLVGRRVLRHADDLVVVLVVHHPSRSAGASPTRPTTMRPLSSPMHVCDRRDRVPAAAPR